MKENPRARLLAYVIVGTVKKSKRQSLLGHSAEMSANVFQDQAAVGCASDSDRAFGNDKTQFLQLYMDLGCAPIRILIGQAPDQDRVSSAI